MTTCAKKLAEEMGMKLKDVTLTVSKYGVTVAIPYFSLFAVLFRPGTYAQDRTAASLSLGLSLVRERGAREEPS